MCGGTGTGKHTTRKREQGKAENGQHDLHEEKLCKWGQKGEGNTKEREKGHRPEGRRRVHSTAPLVT